MKSWTVLASSRESSSFCLQPRPGSTCSHKKYGFRVLGHGLQVIGMLV